MTTSTELSADRDAFEAQVRRHERELQLHLYRMTGSLEESEDLAQETFLRAWRKRDQFAGRSTLRAWLYRIATNACLDALDKRPRTVGPDGEVLWLQPYPDALLEELAADEDGPQEAVVAKETIELAFVVALQHLPPLPRAVLILRDVLDLSAKDTAAMLETTVASVNSALQRAHVALRERLPGPRSEWRGEPSAAERALVARYLEASERADLDALAALLHEEAVFRMPPQPEVYAGRDAVLKCWADGGFGSEAFGSVRCVELSVNRQPALAFYARPPGEADFRPVALDVLRLRDGLVDEVVAFEGRLFERLGLPAALAA